MFDRLAWALGDTLHEKRLAQVFVWQIVDREAGVTPQKCIKRVLAQSSWRGRVTVSPGASFLCTSRALGLWYLERYVTVL